MRDVDYFCGSGGFTLGATMAGLPVDAAANHWAVAVESHYRNHLEPRHICQDLSGEAVHGRPLER